MKQKQNMFHLAKEKKNACQNTQITLLFAFKVKDLMFVIFGIWWSKMIQLHGFCRENRHISANTKTSVIASHPVLF